MSKNSAVILEQDNALPMLLASGMVPVGLLGLILCGLLASQLSSIDSVLTSSSTLISLDVINLFRKKKLTDKQMLLTLRLMLVLLGIIMILTSYLAKAAQSAVDFYISVISVVDLPLFVVGIIYGLLWKRATPAGAIVGYGVGMLTGLALQFHAYLGSTVTSFVDSIFSAYTYIPILGEGVTAANANGWDIAVIGMIVTAITVPVVSMFTRQSHPEQVQKIWQAKHISPEEGDMSGEFNVWPLSRKGRVYIVIMLVGLIIFMAGLVLGKFPEQQGYSISRLEMHHFEQSALLITAENLPAGISVESRQELFNDMIFWRGIWTQQTSSVNL